MNIELRNEDVSVLREEGLVPGILYGHGIDPTNVQVDFSELIKAYHDNGLSISFNVSLDDETHTVFFKEIQKDLFNPNSILHFDLMKVSTSERMTASIPVHLIGRDEIEKKGLVVQLLSDTLDYEFPVTKGVSYINVDISSLDEVDSIVASSIKVPEGFELQEDPSKIVVNVTHPQIETEEDENESTVEPTTTEE